MRRKQKRKWQIITEMRLKCQKGNFILQVEYSFFDYIAIPNT